MSTFAWVTLTTNDTYSLGALVLAHSLRRAGTVHQLAVLVTPGVSESMRAKLKDVYNVVQEVNVMDSQDAANLALLARPELGVTFTKLHCWRLVQYEKCVFLDADTLVLQNCDELFEREELSAAPDVSWPDCFNSGVFVYRPSVDTFGKITEFALEHGSFDGGDQGLLNSYFANWAHTDISKHLPFVYNVTAYASYCYLPAFKQFRDKIKILHFAGKLKPWLIQFNSASKTASTPTDYAHASDLIQLWWNIFCENVHQNLTENMNYWPGIVPWKYNETISHDHNKKSLEHHHQHLHDQQHIPTQNVHVSIETQSILFNLSESVKDYSDPWLDYYDESVQDTVKEKIDYEEENICGTTETKFIEHYDKILNNTQSHEATPTTEDSTNTSTNSSEKAQNTEELYIKDNTPKSEELSESGEATKTNVDKIIETEILNVEKKIVNSSETVIETEKNEVK